MEKIPLHLLPDNETETAKEAEQKDNDFGVLDLEKAKKKWVSVENLLNNDNASMYKKIARIHKFIDWIIEEKQVKKSAVCRPQCAHCCGVDVLVPVIEALYIAKMYGKTVVNREKRIRTGYNKSKTQQYCPFLDKETASCSIYEYRPIVCRSFFAFDNRKFCESMEPHLITTDMSDGNIKQIALMVYDMGGNKHADIREWFKEFTTDPFQGEYTANVQFEVNTGKKQ